MEKKLDVDEDLLSIVEDFVKWREVHTESVAVTNELRRVTQVLKEQLSVTQEAEKSERYKLANSRGVLLHQQDVISKLLGVKDENIKLCDRIKLLENTLAEFKENFAKEKEIWHKQIKENNELHDKILAQLRKDTEKEGLQSREEMLGSLKKSQEKEDILLWLTRLEREGFNFSPPVTETKAELETVRADASKKLNDINKKLEVLEQEKKENIDGLVTVYEAKLKKCQEELTSTKLEREGIKKRADANMQIYRKKLLDIENQYTAELEKLKTSIYSPSSRPSHPFLSYSYPPSVSSRKSAYELESNSSSTKTSAQGTVSTAASETNSSTTTSSTNFQGLETTNAFGAQGEESGDRASATSVSGPLKTTSSLLSPLPFHEGHDEFDRNNNVRSLYQNRVMFPVVKKRKLFTSGSSLL